MPENNTQDIHIFYIEWADDLIRARKLLPGPMFERLADTLVGCMIDAEVPMTRANVELLRHLDTPADTLKNLDDYEEAEQIGNKVREMTAVEATWPAQRGDNWIDSAGTVFEKVKHAWNKATKMPSVTADGTFRNARHSNKGKGKGNGKAAETTTAPSDETKMLESNQVLASFRTHVEDATSDERLEQIGAQIELMGFTPEELALARDWIETRSETIAAG